MRTGTRTRRPGFGWGRSSRTIHFRTAGVESAPRAGFTTIEHLERRTGERFERAAQIRTAAGQRPRARAGPRGGMFCWPLFATRLSRASRG